jgi:hypothetical protein
MAKLPQKEELLHYEYNPPATDWMDSAVEFKPGTFCYGAKGKNLETVHFPNARDWSPVMRTGICRKNWQVIFLNGWPSVWTSIVPSGSLWMSACAAGPVLTNVIFYMGSGDPKICRVTRRNCCGRVTADTSPPPAKLLGRLAVCPGPERRSAQELWYYFYQCTNATLFRLLPYGIDQAELPSWAGNCSIYWAGLTDGYPDRWPNAI